MDDDFKAKFTDSARMDQDYYFVTCEVCGGMVQYTLTEEALEAHKLWHEVMGKHFSSTERIAEVLRTAIDVINQHSKFLLKMARKRA